MTIMPQSDDFEEKDKHVLRLKFCTMWYRLSHIRGEYWLTEDGPQYAEGDDNHEMLAESHMLNQLGNDIEDEGWGTQTYYNARNMFFDMLYNPATQIGAMEEYIEYLQTQHGEDWGDFANYEDYIMWLNTKDVTDEDQRNTRENWVSREFEGMKDPRKHVSQYYDWVAVRGTNVEAWELNDLTRRRIEHQIEDIFDEEGIGEDESWKTKPMFKLSILSTGQYIPNLTFFDLITQGVEKKKGRENQFDSFPDYRTTTKIPTKIPGYQYQGG
jgi:hypothetical protein